MRVVLIPWGNVIEDFLDPLDLEVDAFVTEMDGGWLFGWVRALQQAGATPAIVCVSRSVRTPLRRIHTPTGAAMWLLPPSLAYRAARRGVDDPFAWGAHRAVRRDAGAAARLTGRLAHHALPYVSTPPIALSRALRDLAADAVVCQEYEHARLEVVLAVGRRLGIPVLATFQGGSLSRTPLERCARRRAVRASAGLIIGSAREAERVSREYGTRIRVMRIANPIDLAEWPVGDRGAARARLGIDPAAAVVAWHGRVDIERKGLDVLVDAWSAVTSARPDRALHLLLVGAGEDSPTLHDLIARHGLRGVRWVDQYVLDRTIIRENLAAADVAVCPSRIEGFPVAVLEAMASGRALVASDANGIPDVINGDQDGGVVVSAGDADAFAAALGSLLDDRTRAERLGAAARHRVEESFSLAAIGKQLVEALARINSSR